MINVLYLSSLIEKKKKKKKKEKKILNGKGMQRQSWKLHQKKYGRHFAQVFSGIIPDSSAIYYGIMDDTGKLWKKWNLMRA